LIHRILAALAALCAVPAAAETVNCTNITLLPATITVQGVYCLKQDLATSMTSGAAITINTNNVTIDFNGFKLGGLGGGAATQANGVVVDNRQNITLRNGNIRGFRFGIAISAVTSSGHLIEDNLIDGSTMIGILLAGKGMVVRRNRIVNTDTTPPPSPGLAPARPDANPAHADPRSAGSAAGVAPMAGQGGTGWGIYASALENSEISDNFVSNTVSSGNQSLAIMVTQSDNVAVLRNTILGTRSLDGSRGILFVQSTPPTNRITVSDNVVSGASQFNGPSVGIRRSTNGIMYCSNNVVDGFNISTQGCNAEEGTFPAP
jgi:hypothetical protein